MGLSSVIYTLFQGVAEWIGFPWRNQSEWGGDLNRNQVAEWIGFGWRLAPEYAIR
ncbi:MAG: hypothetical protein NTZ24_14770 [Deltaproteobacteria bacterium]|nr:hypothetical protein [Deltaproteobacteria bacterium]